MKLYQIIASAQGGRTFHNMAEAYGFSEEVMAQTVRYFVPPIAKAIERKSETPEGLLSVLEFLGSRRYDRFLHEARVFGHEKVAAEGVRALEYLFVKPARIQKIVNNRAQVLPLDAAQLETLFPVIAILAIGAIEIRTRRPLGVILHRLTKGTADSRSIANPYLVLAQHLKKSEREDKERRRRRLFSFFGLGASSDARAHASHSGASPLLQVTS